MLAAHAHSSPTNASLDAAVAAVEEDMACGEIGTPEPERPRFTRRGRILLAIVFGVVVVAGAGTLIAIGLAQEPPRWWRTIDPKDPVLAARAQNVENGAATQLTKIRSGADAGASESTPWTIALRAEDANAWLATRLGKWVDSQENSKIRWPKEVGQVQVSFDDGLITLAASVHPGGNKGGGQPQVLSASLRPELKTDGSLWMPASQVSLGRLAMPASWMISGSGGSSKLMGEVPASIRNLPETKDMLKVFAGEMAAMRNATIRIGDGRRVRLLKLEAKGGALYMTCQTLPRETATASGN